MIVLTSISEGQPLVILESFSAHKPVIATNVGNCRGLILGEHDDFGAAGISTRIMNVEETAHAMIALARNEPLRVQMGENGYQRVMSRFQMTQLQDTYETSYKDFADSMQIAWETGKGSADTGRKAAEETCKHTAEIEEEPDKESGRS